MLLSCITSTTFTSFPIPSYCRIVAVHTARAVFIKLPEYIIKGWDLDKVERGRKSSGSRSSTSSSSEGYIIRWEEEMETGEGKKKD